jgi:hypothetical protein
VLQRLLVVEVVVEVVGLRRARNHVRAAAVRAMWGAAVLP